MSKSFSLFLALRYLKPKRTFLSTITLVSILGVTLGIMVLILVISVMTGFEQAFAGRALPSLPDELATALAAVFGLLSLGSELRAIAITAKALRANRAFPRSDDEDATIECAIAHAWLEAVPPVLRLLQ